MNEILISPTIPSHPDLERVHLFAGRHMGEEEFERQQAYVDRRLAPLLTHVHPGIVYGLQVRLGEFSSGQEGFSVSPGLALAGNGQSLGLYYPLRQMWSSLIEDYIKETGAQDASGVFYLTLRRTSRYIDSDPTIDPCQRDEFDPTRDARRVVVGNLALKRLGLDSALALSEPRDRIENWVAANNVDGIFLKSMQTAVPLGLLAVANTGNDVEGNPIYAVNWFSEAAGRYHAVAHSGYHVLLQQVSHTFRRLLLAADGVVDETTSVQDFLLANIQLDFLPAAGELPKELLSNIASTSPSVSWFPPHVGIDMVAVPEESVNDIIERHLPRRVVDLRQAAGDRLRLLLAVNEPDYKPTLLDYPATDSQLHSDIYFYFQRAHQVWQQWLRQFNYLYFLREEDVLDAAQLRALALPEPIAPPQLPQNFFQQVIDESLLEVGPDSSNQPQYPYNNGIPGFPDFYRRWGREVPADSGVFLPPVDEDPIEDGLVIQYTVAQVELEALDNEIRDIRGRLEKTRDFLLLQRQQLDNQTVSLAALAGGVAGDGSGLQVARWLPFTNLRQETQTTPPDDDTPPPPTSPQPSPARSFTPIVAGIAAASLTQTPTLLAAKSQATSNKLVFSSALRQLPTIQSSLQFNINNLRLDKLTQVTKQALTKPAFTAQEYRFGTLDHVRPELQEYKKAQRGMRELLSTLDGLFHTAEAKSIKALFRKIENDQEDKVPTLESLGVSDNTRIGDPNTLQQLVPRLYAGLFTMGKILTQQIAYMEGRYARIEALLEGKLRSRLRQEGVIEKLAALIRQATEELTSIDKRRLEYLGDYGVAQRLLDDDWLQIYKQNQERTRILTTGVRGLYYVREQQTPISQVLADPLALRYGKAGDAVPGCDWEEEVDVPQELADFFDTVLEIPVSDWSAIKELEVHLPVGPRLEYVTALRNVRLQQKTAQRISQTNLDKPVRISLNTVRVQTHAVLTQFARVATNFDADSRRNRQSASAKVLSLEDVLAGSRGHLQREAQTLHNRLEQAIHCLLEKLNELPPSVRLMWQQLAEDDRIDVTQVPLWPGLDRAERDDFNATRTVAELVQWWFRQIKTDASADTKSAMRNMIRAALIHAALGDPTEIVQGQVQVPPRRLALGESLRLKLNQPAKPGTVLQLLDTQQRLVALLNIKDEDQQGVIAQVNQVTLQNAVVNTQFKVVASKAMKVLL